MSVGAAARSAQFLHNLQRFRLITFDVTDTLLAFREPPAIQYARTAAAFGVSNIDPDKLHACFRKSFKAMSDKHPNFGSFSPDISWQTWWIDMVKDVFHCVDKTLSAEKREAIAHKLLHIYRTKECWSEMDGARELLDRISESRKILGVISNFDASLPNVLEEMDLNEPFDFVLTSYGAGVQKPHEHIFQIPLKDYSVKPHQALHIGNLYDVDYMGARNAGYSSLLLTPKTAASAEDVQPGHQYSSLKELLVALETTDIEW